MGNEVTLYENAEFGKVRVVMRGGEPWFVAADIATVLDIQNIRQNLGLLDEDEKGVCKIYTPGGGQDATVVSESGLYALTLRSNKPNAKMFSRWVRKEVLPSIRKTGSYSLNPALPDFNDPVAAARAWADAVEAKRNTELALAQTQVTLATVREHDAKATEMVGRLVDYIGYGENMRQVKAVDWLSDYFVVKNKDRDSFWGCMGKCMVMLCAKHGFRFDERADSAWGKVKVYPIEAFDELCRELDEGEITSTSKYIGKFLK